jgi:branched-chain amino acid transport system substrate-binding protein
MTKLKARAFFAMFLTSIVFLAITLSACSKPEEKKEVKQDTKKEEIGVIKIGAILPLTGNAALYGSNDREGIDLAVDLSNAEGGINGGKITVLYEDSKGEAKTGVSAINKLVNSKVQIIIDDAISTITLAMLPIATQKKIIILSTGATNPSLSGASPYFFRIWNSDSEEGVFAAKAAYDKLGFKRMAILYVNNDYGIGLKNVFREKYSSLGGQIVAGENFERGGKDFKNILLKIRQVAPEAIYLVGYASETGVITKQLKELKITSRILGTVAMEDTEFLKLAGKGAEGVIYVYPKPPTGTAVQEFKATFKKKYGKDPGILCDVGYDAGNLIIYAYQHGAETADDIRKVFAELKNFQGASGEIKFDKNGDVHKPMILKMIKNGTFMDYK